ncbi:MBL fold metallo-hydrolase [Rhodoplanes sp. Z2-YC6860]|uniref:MBL fold metallo-hydrolase n=1 Tax=Rhodoplanes sp. Z2-YC6860 TaxID=674703 RepID=UPI0018DBDF14|nr:MBL fold metallo-hydrolase [Rhodoplanes sp. Z2-YC6860]
MAGDVMDAKTEASTKAKPRPQQKPGDVIDGLMFPFADFPAAGESIEVADSIFWVSTPVPFVGLKQVNLWLLRDGDGWAMIDCSYGGQQQRELIEAVWAKLLGGKPIKQLVVTHFHPDHAGGSGWISEKWGLRPWMSHGEWLTANLAVLNRNTDHVQSRGIFYRRQGLDEARVERFLKGVVLYSDGVTLPKSFRRLREDDFITIGNDRWRVIIGEGHAPEHVSLYCAERKILIAGDQILPSITTNVSTWHIEPEFDAVGAFLKSCKKFLDILHPETLILPSHRKPFYNVQHRLRQLAVHHAQRLNVVLDAVGAESSAGALIDVMFTPGLDGHQVGFAMGEAIAHLNHLVALGHLEMIETETQVRYRRISAKDKRVEPYFV